jgi:hypothetical protein
VDPGPVWTGVENLAAAEIRSPDRPARSVSLYRLSYPGPPHADKESIKIRRVSENVLWTSHTVTGSLISLTLLRSIKKGHCVLSSNPAFTKVVALLLSQIRSYVELLTPCALYRVAGCKCRL